MRNQDISKNYLLIPPFCPRLSTSLLHSQLFYFITHSKQHKKMENGGLWSIHMAPLCHFFHLTLFHHSSAGLSYRLQSFRIICSSMYPLCPQFLQGLPPSSTMVFQKLQVNLCPGTWSTFPPFPPLLLIMPSLPSGLGALLLTLIPHPPLLGNIWPFLTQAFPKAPPSWLTGSFVPCGGLIGPGWNGLCPAQGIPDLSSQRLPGPSGVHRSASIEDLNIS